MSDIAAQVMEDNEVESLKARVQLIIDEEALMSESELQNPKNFPPFIQVLQAHRRPEPAWAGLGGKMALEVQKIDEEVQKIDEEMQKFDEKMDKLACGMAELKGEVSQLKELMVKVLKCTTTSATT